MDRHFRDNPRYWRTPLMPQAELLTAGWKRWQAGMSLRLDMSKSGVRLSKASGDF